MRLSLALLLVLTSGSLFGQGKGKAAPKGPEIGFLSRTHNFGTIQEEIQYAKCRFYFENIGDKPLFINRVESSCGCTTPEWSKDSVLPGDTGYIEVRYGTTNRPGTFKKSITVYNNSLNSPFVVLEISGDVVPTPKVVNGTELPDYGHIYFEPGTLEFKTHYDNAVDTLYGRLVNATPFTVNFQGPSTLPPFCEVMGIPSSLEPRESAKVKVIMHGAKGTIYGPGAFEIPIPCDNPIQPGISIYVSYNRQQYFPKMTAKQLAKAPKIKFDKESHNFGEHTPGEIMTTKFEVKNDGKTDLVIKDVFPGCSCLQVSYPKNTLKPGETMFISVTYDSVSKHGQSNQSISLVSNDPTRPEMKLSVSAKFPERVAPCLTCH